MGWECSLPPNSGLFQLECIFKVGGTKNKQTTLLEINDYYIYFVYAFGVNAKSIKKNKSPALIFSLLSTSVDIFRAKKIAVPFTVWYIKKPCI